MLGELMTSLRAIFASMLLLCVGYLALVLGAAELIAPGGRQGDLVEVDGRIIGSWRIGQAFTRPEYLWPRPSAVNYAADAAGGSNLSPANPAIRERAERALEAIGASAARPAPAELVLASGSGLDPHLTVGAALYQAPRIAEARGASVEEIERIVRASTEGWSEEYVNVLRANMELDAAFGAGPGRVSP